MKSIKICLCFMILSLLLSSCSNPSNENVLDIPTDQLEITDSTSNPKKNDGIVNENIISEEIGDTSPISKALAVKMISLLFNDLSNIKTMDKDLNSDSVDVNAWYYKYYNYVNKENYVDLSKDFNPNEPLTIKEAQDILNAINPKNTINMKINAENKDKSISYALFCKLFKETAVILAGEEDMLNKFEINEITLVPLSTSGQNVSVPENYVITDIGLLSCEGLSFDYYIDKEVSVLIKDNEVICALNITNEKPTVKNAYIVNMDSENIKIFCGGAEREYQYKNSLPPQKGKLCNFTISGENKISDLFLIDENINDTIKLISDKTLDLSNHENLLISEDFKVYSIAEGNVKWKNINNLIVGTNVTTFYTKDHLIEGAVINSTPELADIRVVIKTTDFSSFYHDEVSISSPGKLTITADNAVTEYSNNEKIVFSNLNDLKNRIYIESDGLIQINSITRSGDAPKYRGKIEVSPTEKGFLIVNELPIEQYLYAVIPSEMPTSYGLESLKAQAVTARSYAYNQFYQNKFHEYGANVCDSVISQVYNNVSETPLSIEAVDATKGICIKYNGDVISANFFSTSAGTTANNGEVWASGENSDFPNISSPFLQSTKLYEDGEYGDLTKEENAAKYLKSSDITAYDSSSSWFRWNVTMTNEELTNAINNNLKERYGANPKLIKTLTEDGSFKSRYIETIGTLVTIEVLQRGTGGNIMSIKIIGTENTIKVDTEYNIRTLLRPKQLIDGANGIVIHRSDGSKILDYALMPSSFFTMERMTVEDGTVKTINFYGGGNGHGVGMSQVGVKGMVDEGYTYDEVLKHFYKGVEIEKVY